MKHLTLALIAVFGIVTAFSTSAMEPEMTTKPTYNKNRRRVIDVEARAENNFQQKQNDFLADVSNSSSAQDSLQNTRMTGQQLQEFQQQQKDAKKKNSKKQ